MKFMISKMPTQKQPPREVETPWGVTLLLVCLLAPALPVKPLVHTVRDDVPYDRKYEVYDVLQDAHLLPVASLEKGSGYSIPGSGKFRKKIHSPEAKSGPPDPRRAARFTA